MHIYRKAAQRVLLLHPERAFLNLLKRDPYQELENMSNALDEELHNLTNEDVLEKNTLRRRQVLDPTFTRNVKTEMPSEMKEEIEQ